ncbi:MAG: hypothetical protein E7287_05030 [Lachnospiraceae bacterium]|nr:hypothetical protein [Lachnospiraceae bacterium]
MIAFKGFNRDLQATMGRGTFQFEAGKTYEEKECKCAHNGFHCAEDPLCALGYYSSMSDRYFVVRAEGDINQDGYNSRISCTKLTLVKEISRVELGAYACKYMAKYPERKPDFHNVALEKGMCHTKDDFIIVRGKHPQAAGVKGSYVFLVKEKPKSKEIAVIYPFYVDGEEIKESTYYGLRGEELCRKKS